MANIGVMDRHLAVISTQNHVKTVKTPSNPSLLGPMLP